MTSRLHVRDRDLLWRRVDRARNRLIPRAEGRIRRELNAERGRLLSQRSTTVGKLTFATRAWEKALLDVWVASGGVWWTRTVEEILESFPAEKQNIPETLRRITSNPQAMRALRVGIRNRAKELVAANRKLLQRDADKVDRTLSQTIRALYRAPEIRTRAQRLARQEVLDATAELQHEAAVATERALLKEWVSRQDSKVRETHSKADAQYRLGSSPGAIPLDKPFRVGGSKLLRPRDRSLGAAAKETAECRCIERFVPAGRQR